MANISYRAASTLTNRYGWNGGNEYEDEGELNYSNTFYRKYDAQIGRFTGVDMKAEKFAAINPYQYGFNNPVMFNDPTGALTSAEFNTIINTLWNSPFGGTWSSDNGGGGGGGFGGGSNIYLFGNNATATFFGGLASNNINYGFGTDGNLRVNGMFVSSITNRTRNGNAGVSFGGYYENRGNAANGSTLAGVTMGSQFFKYQQTFAYSGSEMHAYTPTPSFWESVKFNADYSPDVNTRIASNIGYGIANTLHTFYKSIGNHNNYIQDLGGNLVGSKERTGAILTVLSSPMMFVSAPENAVGTTVFRAVDAVEGASISNTGKFLLEGGGGIETKYFAQSLEDAHWYGQRLYPEGYSIVTGNVNSTLNASKYWFPHTDIGAYAFPREVLQYIIPH
jgi:RHS repeat-associated protein